MFETLYLKKAGLFLYNASHPIFVMTLDFQFFNFQAYILSPFTNISQESIYRYFSDRFPGKIQSIKRYDNPNTSVQFFLHFYTEDDLNNFLTLYQDKAIVCLFSFFLLYCFIY
jgi:hypothetical protein